MGKTAAGAVWLDADKLPVFDYWQYWRNTEDADVGRFLRLFTDLPEAEIQRLERLGGTEINQAKVVLATEATALCHGREAALVAEAAARAVFGGEGGIEGLPEITVEGSRLAEGVSLIELLTLAGLAGSNGEARRLVRGGGVRVNDRAVSDETLMIHSADLDEGALKLSAGKKRHVLVRRS
jgi:tyrosyl-tRNA synthetase